MENPSPFELVQPEEAVAVATPQDIDPHLMTQIEVARKHPRVLSRVKQEMLSFATLDEETAAACFYSLPRGNKTIQGPSIRLAEIAAVSYENLKVGTRIIDEAVEGPHPHVRIEAAAWDMQKNVAFSIQKRRRILPKKDRDGGYRPVDDDDINLAVNACSATALRDAIFKIVPRALIQPVYEQARSVAIGDAKTFSTRRASAFERLAKMGITEDRVLAALGRAKMDDVQLGDLETLYGSYTAIKDGQVSIETAFPELKATEKQPKAPALGKKAKEDAPKQEAPAGPPPPVELALLLAKSGVNEETFMEWARIKEYAKQAHTRIDQMPASTVSALIKNLPKVIADITQPQGQG